MLTRFHAVVQLFVALYLFIFNCFAFQGAFWIVTDVHINLNYSINGDISQYCMEPYHSHRRSLNIGYFGNHSCDPPYPLLASTLTYLKNNYGNDDFILWTGDNGPHNSKILSQLGLVSSIVNVTESFQRYLPKAKVLPVLGNHDVFPKDILDSNGSWCERLADVWSSMLDEINVTDVFRKGCYYEAVFHDGGLRVLVLNTLIYYRSNSDAHDSELDDPAGQFQWLRARLADAEAHSSKAIIVSHIPLGATEISPQNYRHLCPHYNERLLKLFRHYSSVIIFGLSAHQHTDSFRIVHSNNGSGLFPFLLSPSVTPLHLRGVGWSIPTIRRVQYNSSMLKDMEQHHFNLSQANGVVDSTHPEPILSSLKFWKLQYRLSESYNGMFKMGAPVSVWAQLADNLRLNINDSYYSYIMFHLGGGRHDYATYHPIYICFNYCAITNLDFDQLDTCLLSKCDEGLISRLAVPITLFIIALFCGGLVVYSLIVNKALCSSSRGRHRYVATPLPQNNNDVIEDDRVYLN